MPTRNVPIVPESETLQYKGTQGCLGFHCNVVCVVNYLQQFLYNTMIVPFSPSTPRPEPTVVKITTPSSVLLLCFSF